MRRAIDSDHNCPTTTAVVDNHLFHHHDDSCGA
jgi:hypothetical protein